MNTATIMDMMFNTEMIVKDMKGGKEDMTEKRFEMIITSADGSFHYLDKNTGEKIISTLELENKLNALHEENQTLKEEIKDFQTLLASREEVYIKPIIRTIEEAYENERTHIGRNVLRQLLEVIQ